jgi:hypothetical protein
LHESGEHSGEFRAEKVTTSNPSSVFATGGKTSVCNQWLREKLLPIVACEFHLVRFVVEEFRAIERNRVLKCDTSNYLWRVKKPIAIVLPEVDVIRKIIADTTAHRVNVSDLKSFQPVRAAADSLRHVPDWNHWPQSSSGPFPFPEIPSLRMEICLRGLLSRRGRW